MYFNALLKISIILSSGLNSRLSNYLCSESKPVCIILYFHLQILQSAFQAHYGGVSTMGLNQFLQGTSGRHMTSHPAAQTTERGQLSNDKENIPVLSFPFSPVTPGGGSVTHNITRMLAESQANNAQERSPDANRYTDCHTPEFAVYPHQENERNNKGNLHCIFIPIFCIYITYLSVLNEYIKH